VNAQADMDQYADCGAWLLPEDSRPEGTAKTPCGECGSTRRIKSVASHIKAGAELSADVTLIIGWQEVDRLLDKNEYAAALLVAAVNVEFILWETLLSLSRASPPSKKTHYSEWKAWQAMEKHDRDSVGLGALIQLAHFFVDGNHLALATPLKPFGWPLNEARKGIAHKRGYFARLTRLEDPDWPETRIRQVLAYAKAFCQANG